MRLSFSLSLGVFPSSYFIYHQYIILAYHFFRRKNICRKKCCIICNNYLTVVSCFKVQLA